MEKYTSVVSPIKGSTIMRGEVCPASWGRRGVGHRDVRSTVGSRAFPEFHVVINSSTYLHVSNPKQQYSRHAGKTGTIALRAIDINTAASCLSDTLSKEHHKRQHGRGVVLPQSVRTRENLGGGGGALMMTHACRNSQKPLSYL